MLTARTQRLELHPLCDSDREDLLAVLRDEVVGKTYMVPELDTEEQAAKVFERLKELSCTQDHYVAGIFREGRLIGFLNDVEIKDGQIEMGYALHSAFHGQGYGTEAFQEAIGALFAQGFREVRAGAFDTNLASIRVMEKCGMEKIDLEEQIPYRGQIYRCVYYAIRRQMTE